MRRKDLITPEGTRDLLFDECLARRIVENKFSTIFSNRGYSEVVTTGLEFYDVFSRGSRAIPQENLYKLTDSKGRIITIRPDSTIPIARLVATRLKEASLPLRLFYIQSVYENNALLKGHSDEIVQAGIELIGSSSKKADFEILSMAMETLSAFEKDSFRIEIGNIGFFNELVSKLNIDSDTKEEIAYLVSTKSYSALNDLLDTIGDNNVIKALKQLPRLFGGEEVFEKASSLFSDEKIECILSELKKVYSNLSKLGFAGKIIVDLGTTNKNDYYSGLIFRGYLEGIGEPVLSGGRYDKLINEFGYDIAATGFGINVNAVSTLLLKSDDAPTLEKSEVIVFSDDTYMMDAINYANELAKNGVKCENSLFATLEETVEYAKKNKIKKIININEKIEEINVTGGAENE